VIFFAGEAARAGRRRGRKCRSAAQVLVAGEAPCVGAA
jgi:hypothetical protein